MGVRGEEGMKKNEYWRVGCGQSVRESQKVGKV